MGQAAEKIERKAELLSLTQIGKRVNLNRVTVGSRLEDLGYEPDASSTLTKQLYWFDDEMAFALKSAKDSYAAMKIRDLRAAAQLKEVKLAEARGELVPSYEVVEIVQRIVGTMYQEFTTRQPKRIAPKLARVKSVIEVKKVLKADTDRIMKSLRENFERFLSQ
jgi:hypothetical protein